MSHCWISRLMARYALAGVAAFEPRSRKTEPNALGGELGDLIVRLRKELAETGHHAGPETIAWHLERHHGHRVSRTSISAYLVRAALMTPGES